MSANYLLPFKYTIPKRPLTWLITGCSSGFGLSLARIAQANGHKVIATSRNPSRTPQLVAEIEGKGGKWVQLDVDSAKSGQVIDDLEASGEAIDILVNNAGFCIFAAVEQSTEDEARSLMETLYFGPLRLTKALIPYMRKRKFGTVVNISTGAALEGRDTMGLYAGAKAGLDGMARVLAKEVGPFNIRVLTVYLGTFNTDFDTKMRVAKNPLPDAYKGCASEQMLDVMSSGKLQTNGDKDKAMQATYEVVAGVGAGAGREGERILPLGADLEGRVQGMQDQFAHTWQVFGEVSKSVARDK